MAYPPPRHRGWLPALAVLALTAGASPLHAAAPPANPAPAATTGRAATTRAQLAQVRAEIARIAAAQHATAAQRASINAELAAGAAQLNAAANALRESDAAIATDAAKLAALQQQQTQVQVDVAQQRSTLGALLRAAYALNRGSDLEMLLGGTDIARVDRAIAYSRYFQREQVTRIHDLLASATRLDRLAESIRVDTVALQAERVQRAAQEAQLEQARAAQQKLLAQADATLTRQKDKLAALQHDADALTQLLKQLQSVFADIPAQLGANAPFAQLRGRLPWPVPGEVRSGADAPALGVVIAAAPGAIVRAVAYGRVAWANFMRGYGMLVIIDDGGGWMSLYGGNESASVTPGEWVRPGEAIATVASDSEMGGAWFGLRHGGRPIDPRGWFATRR